jgi:lysophospholipase L1-like esterase
LKQRRKETEERIRNDWAYLGRYKEENEKLGPPEAGEDRIVLMGNSITARWSGVHPEFFSGKPYINRGIGGQTTPQMLIRFKQDVIDLKPSAVVILAGINDIAQATGPSTIEGIMDNISGMALLAKANGIKVILSSVLPAYDFPSKPGLEPAGKVVRLNEMIKDFAAKNNIYYLDYYSSMVDERKGLKKELSNDEVHPTLEGYKIMERLLEKAIENVMKKK